MSITLTAVYRKVPEGYIGYVEELPGANTQGETIEETRENLKEAVDLVIEANRALARERTDGEEICAKTSRPVLVDSCSFSSEPEPLKLSKYSRKRSDLLD